MFILNQNVQDREVVVNWNKLVAAIEGCPSALCFQSMSSSDHQYVNSSSTSESYPLTLKYIVTNAKSSTEFESSIKEKDFKPYLKNNLRNDLIFLQFVFYLPTVIIIITCPLYSQLYFQTSS